MTKFGQAEYSDFMARVFADKLDEILEASRKTEFQQQKYRRCIRSVSVFKGRSVRRYRYVRICYWTTCRRYCRSIHNVSLYCGKAGQMKICQIRTSNFVRFGDTILKRFVVSLLVERRVRKCRQ